MHKVNRALWGVALALGVMGCARTEEARSRSAAVTKQPLRDLSAVPIGAGYDRALDVERGDCFARDPKTMKSLRTWEATGFTVYTAAEVGPRVHSAFGVGVKIDSESTPLGQPTSILVGESGEQPLFVALARYTSHIETPGAALAAGSRCASVSDVAANGLDDFVGSCGDSYLASKSYGGHLLLSWRRSPTRPAVDELMGSMLGARTVGGTFDLISNLTAIKQAGLGNEELFVEWSGLPAPPTVTMPNGVQGRTVELMLRYLSDISQLAPISFPRVTDFKFERFQIDQVDLCLAATKRQSTISDPEWACIYEHLAELVDARDGTGELAHFHDKYIDAKLVRDILVPAGRVVFNTVPQSRCPNYDDDGDPNVEASGRCQAQSVADFVAFYEACASQSGPLATDCRNDVLSVIDSCGDFEARGCKAKELTLSSGQRVTCSEAGMAAAMADMVPWIVNPPIASPPLLDAPTTFLIDDPTAKLPFTPATHFCAITGVRGGLHATSFSIEDWSTEWHVILRHGSSDPAFRVQLEVSCTAWQNFHFYNGGSHLLAGTSFISVPLLNASGFSTPLARFGVPFLAGVQDYLDEPRTSVRVDNPDSSGFGSVYVVDLFPTASANPIAGAFVVSANPPASGPPVGGEAASGQPGGPSNFTAGFGYPGRALRNLSTSLPANHFCFLTGLLGRYYNTSDWVRVDTSDGFTTLRATTPLDKDRNPSMRVQCVSYDHP